MTLPFHPLADLFPLIEGAEFSDFVASIKANGLREAVVVHDGMVLDGRNRQRACEAAGVDCIYEPFPPDQDPLQFVIDKNLRRRHMSESQRAFAAAKIANIEHGGGRRIDDQAANLPLEKSIPAVSQAAAAKLFNVSERSVRDGKAVQQYGTHKLQRAVEVGTLAISAAAAAAKLDPEKQRRIAKEAEAGRANVVRAVIKREARAGRERELGKKQQALTAQNCGIIYVDIPRHFDVRSDETGSDRAPENHYPTMTFEQVLALPVPSIAAADCILIFWSTAASLIDDLDIMAEWGFVALRPRGPDGKLLREREAQMLHEVQGRYCSMQVWDKVRIGMGYWFRDRHEFILIGTRGKIVPPAPGTQEESLFSELKGEHSSKPDRVAVMIERLWPNTPKIHLFHRGPARPGWLVWGNQSQRAISPRSFPSPDPSVFQSDTLTGGPDSRVPVSPGKMNESGRYRN